MDRDLDRFLQRSLEAVSRYMHLLSYIFAWSRNNSQPVRTTIVSNVLLLRILNKSFVNPVSLWSLLVLLNPPGVIIPKDSIWHPFSLCFYSFGNCEAYIPFSLFYLAPVFSIIWIHSLVS